MAYDEAVYPDPSEFRPERFMNIDARARDMTDPRGIVFGFGRRYVFFLRVIQHCRG